MKKKLVFRDDLESDSELEIELELEFDPACAHEYQIGWRSDGKPIWEMEEDDRLSGRSWLETMKGW